MLLGGTIIGQYRNMDEWETLLVRSRFRAITAPFDCNTDKRTIEAFLETAGRHDVTIAESGVWRNVMDSDPEAARQAIEYAKRQLAIADEYNIRCCVNIAGTSGCYGWDAADISNYKPETYEKSIRIIQEIIDDVKPTRAYYCIEPMPWMVPDGPDEYLDLIRDVQRPMFAAHMDFVNMINSPRRFLKSEAFISECFSKLAPYIRSTHIKDSRMDMMKLTTTLEECPPGEGMLDFGGILRIIHEQLPKDAPVLLEHMQTEEEYRRAYDFLSAKALEESIPI